MPLIELEQLDIFLLEDSLWIASAHIGVPSYDFSFHNFFACRHPLYRPDKITAVGRFRVTDNYPQLYEKLKDDGIRLIHTPLQQQLISELPSWYPLLKDLTPKSAWFDIPPTFDEIEKHFSLPVFIKGGRQISKDKAELSIAYNQNDYEKIKEQFQLNPILHWQKFVCREFVELRKVPHYTTDKIPPSFEFRTFWWKGHCVGAGSYWSDFASYDWNMNEKLEGLHIAETAVQRLDVPFVVIDIAQTKEGEWIVIECNDAQESGYAAISPIGLWQRIIEIEKGNLINE